MTKTIRVFPRRTSMTPTDDMAFVGDPPLDKPEADEVHVSCTFTWDKPSAERLALAWRQYYPVVKLGGPAYDDAAGSFIQGLYTKPSVTITSRGCPWNCEFCSVPKREGKIRELDVQPGSIIQDNNLLRCSKPHIRKVFDMCRSLRRAVQFKGGLEARAFTDEWAEELRGVRIAEVWFAADQDGSVQPLQRAVRKLSGLGRNRLRCYVLLAHKGESMERGLRRLELVWEAGCLPFAQLYQPEGHWIDYSPEWRALARIWSRPAATKAVAAQALAERLVAAGLSTEGEGVNR